MKLRTLFRINVMIQSCKYNSMSDQYIISNKDSALVLKLAVGINENSFSNMDIFPEIRIEWRKQGERIIHRFPDQLKKELLKFRRVMLLWSDLHRDLLCLSA